MLFHNLFAAAHLLSLCIYLRLKQKRIFVTYAKNSVPEITDLLRYWSMLGIFGGKALELLVILIIKIQCTCTSIGVSLMKNHIIFTAGWVNEVLSWKAFVPLGRLTYSAYLIHPLVMLVFYMSRNSPTYFSIYEVVSIHVISVLSIKRSFTVSSETGIIIVL